MRKIERLRRRHRIQVLQAHEDTAKDNAVSAPSSACFRYNDRRNNYNLTDPGSVEKSTRNLSRNRVNDQLKKYIDYYISVQ